MLPRHAPSLRAIQHLQNPLRSQSRSSSTSAALNSPTNRLRNAVRGTVLLSFIGFTYLQITDSRSSLHRYMAPRLLRAYYSGDDVHSPGPEAAHTAGISSLRSLHTLGFPVHERGDAAYLRAPDMATDVLGWRLNTPLAISAGLDKHGEAIDALFDLSPAISILEIGCITPKPQPGNDKPRMFRIPSAGALINRYGFNSHGADLVAVRLRERVRRYARVHGLSEAEVLANPNIPKSLKAGRLLAVQIGKNKTTSETDLEAVKKDYRTCVSRLGNYADALVVNVSSPNTPGLRSLQKGAALTELLGAVVEETKKLSTARKPAVVVKVSPDSDSDSEISEICAAIKKSGVAGVIVANTTVSRPASVQANPKATWQEKEALKQAGGLSGPPLLGKTVGLVETYRKVLGEGTEVWASGGVSKGEDVELLRRRGAGVVMAYTGMVYGGAGFFGKVARELAGVEK